MRTHPQQTLMALHTRRRLLQAATALAASLAGCGGFSGSASHSETVAAGGSAPPDSNSETDPPQLVARGGAERPPIRLADEDGETPDDDPERRLGPRDDYAVVDSSEMAARLTVADGVDVRRGDGVRRGDALPTDQRRSGVFPARTLLGIVAARRDSHRLRPDGSGVRRGVRGRHPGLRVTARPAPCRTR